MLSVAAATGATAADLRPVRPTPTFVDTAGSPPAVLQQNGFCLFGCPVPPVLEQATPTVSPDVDDVGEPAKARRKGYGPLFAARRMPSHEGRSVATARRLQVPATPHRTPVHPVVLKSAGPTAETDIGALPIGWSLRAQPVLIAPAIGPTPASPFGKLR